MRMIRREFITLLGGAAAAWRLAASVAVPTTGYAQTWKKPFRIGVIAFAENGLRTHLDQSLIEGLREKGYVEGVNLILEWRYDDGYSERVPQIANELAGMKLDAIVTTCTPTTLAMTAAAHKTLFVMAAVSDPVGQGLIASYPHPGGKITGTATQFEDLAAKMFQLLHETAPNAGSIAVPFNPRNPVHKLFLADIEAPNRLFGLKLATFQIGQLDHLATAFDDMRSAGVDAMVLPDDSYLFNLRDISLRTWLPLNCRPCLACVRRSRMAAS